MKEVVIKKMTNEIDLIRKTLKQYDRATRLKKLNEELYAHLTGSVYYILKYAEKHQISLPQKEALLGMIEKADFIIDHFAKPYQPRGNTHNTTEEGTEPDARFCYLIGCFC